MAEARRLVAALLLVVLGLSVPHRAGSQEPVEFYHDFRGARALPAALVLAGPDAEAVCRPEPEGLRVMLPAARSAHHPVVVTTTFGLTGDFEMTAGYELLATSRPTAGYGVGVALNVATDAGRFKFAKVARIQHVDKGNVYCAEYWSNAPPKGYWGFKPEPSEARAGRLGLRRTGPTIRFLVADAADKDFREIEQRDIGADEMASVQFEFIDSGQPGNTLDARLVDLRIRSPGLKSPAAAVPPRRSWLMLAVLCIVVLLLTALGLWGYARRSQREQAEGSPEATAED